MAPGNITTREARETDVDAILALLEEWLPDEG